MSNDPTGRSSLIIILMGVSGSGKTAVGQLLAPRLGWPFYDGDEFHPAANVAKMAQGIALNDADRQPWLAALRRLIESCVADGRPAIIACSALKQQYRHVLSHGRPEVQFVYLRGDYALIHGRLQQRRGHFMNPDLLASQFAALEEPAAALVIPVNQEPAAIVNQIMNAVIG